MHAGTYRHFADIASSVGLPLLLYDVPSRTGVDSASDALMRPAVIPNVVGLTDATGDLVRPSVMARAAGAGFLQLSGHEATAIASNHAGGRGASPSSPTSRHGFAGHVLEVHPVVAARKT